MEKDNVNSSRTTMGYNNIQVMPYELKSLLELRIERKINDHVRVYLTGIIPEEVKVRYLTEENNILTVDLFEEGTGVKSLFNGTVTDMTVKTVRDIYYIEIEGVSHTFDMDVKLKKRSFQDREMQYTQLIKNVISDYPGADFIDIEARSKKTDRFIIQYQETDWEFLKRMASHFNTGLVPDVSSNSPKFSFGIPQGSSKYNLDDFHYSVRKRFSQYREFSENYMEYLEENGFIYYEVESDRLLNIGDLVKFKDKKLFVYQSTTIIKESTVRHQYLLTPLIGLRQKPVFNTLISGVSVEGKVIDIHEDHIRVHLEIDYSQNKEEAYWFPYSTFYTAEGNTGWYCMPELDDSVKLYFPTHEEDEGVIINSIRKGTTGADKIHNPDIKYFRTKFGKEILFSEKEIIITAKDGEVLMRLNEDEGIEVFSTKQVKVTAKENMTVNTGKKLVITAGEEIDIKCKASNIRMDGVTYIKGSQVRTN
ncbi:MAG: contractile injection system protein, VgrG/Pvc8 family [Clostridia bacterium]|nr:contractile injection system protein, VgrG/Pvc8 family [Clostridia bacterium]